MDIGCDCTLSAKAEVIGFHDSFRTRTQLVTGQPKLDVQETENNQDHPNYNEHCREARARTETKNCT